MRRVLAAWLVGLSILAACTDGAAVTTTAAAVTSTVPEVTTTSFLEATSSTTEPSTTTTTVVAYPYDFAVHPRAPVIEPGSWDSSYTAVPWVIELDGVWHLFYSGATQRSPDLGLATSEDGVVFEKVTVDEPLFEPRGRGLGWFFIFETDTQWEMLYVSGFTPPYRDVERATAPDVLGPWTDQGKAFKAPDREWDRSIVPTGVNRIGDTYYLPYGGWGQQDLVPAIGLMVSPDGVAWEPMTEEPIYTATEGEWDEFGVVPMNIVETEHGLELFYLGFSEPPMVGFQAETIPFGRLVSSDGGQTWTPDNDGAPIGDTGEQGWPGVSVVYDSGEYRLYLGDDLGGSGISLLTGTIP